jgi:hypothetical protein
METEDLFAESRRTRADKRQSERKFRWQKMEQYFAGTRSKGFAAYRKEEVTEIRWTSKCQQITTTSIKMRAEFCRKLAGNGITRTIPK